MHAAEFTPSRGRVLIFTPSDPILFLWRLAEQVELSTLPIVSLTLWCKWTWSIKKEAIANWRCDKKMDRFVGAVLALGLCEYKQQLWYRKERERVSKFNVTRFMSHWKIMNTNYNKQIRPDYSVRGFLFWVVSSVGCFVCMCISRRECNRLWLACSLHCVYVGHLRLK